MDRKERFTLYPTASQIISKFHDDMQHAAYSLIEPRSSIERHTGQENRTGEFLRIHIPLIIPEGDLYFECMGEVIYWDDIWGFNNQLTHSAHNNTDEYRLIFLLDLRMSALGLEPCGQFDPKWQLHAKPFIREKQ
jgi:aspartyl/asparaginyl beta-hydroxylase (cupin superfamily)